MAKKTDETELLYEEAEKSLVDYRYLLLENDETHEAEPADYHYTWSDMLLNGDGNEAIQGYRESAKALPLDTLLPTPSGFRTISELAVGDEVFGIDGIASKIIAKSIVFHNQCYKVEFDDGTECVCNESHLWYVWDKKQRKFQVRETKYMAENPGGWDHKNGYKERRYRLPVCSAVQYQSKKLKLDPYVLGFWLGDGNSDCSIFTVGKQDIEEITSQFKQRGYVLKELKSSENRYSITGYRSEWNSYNLLLNKHIPNDYKLSSIHDRVELIRGLVDSDGTLAPKGSKRGTITFSNTNKKLAYDFLEVVRSLGIKATIRSRIPKLYGKECARSYRISFKTEYKMAMIKRKDNTAFSVSPRSKFKSIINIQKVETVPTQCIAVDSKHNTFLVSKDYTVTHNTQYVLRAFPLHALTFPDTKRDYIVIIKNNATLAQSKLKEIETEYTTNGLLSANMVKIREQSASVFSVDVKNSAGEVMNVRIEAYGKGSSIRGLSHKERRPKIIICDDLQDREEMRGETVPENDWKWFMSDVYFLGKTSRIFLIGNNLGEKCIVERIISASGDLGFKCQRISSIKLDEEGKETSAWPAKFELHEIYKQREQFRRQGLLGIWLEEKMCQATSEETKTFKKADRRYYVPAIFKQIRAVCNVDATLDPATSLNPGACFRAITVKGIDKDNHWFVLDVRYGRWEPDETINQMFDVAKMWFGQESSFGIEKGMFKQLMEPFIYKEMSKRNQFFTIAEIEHAKRGSKLERVKMMAPRYAAHTIWHPEEATWLAELENELDGVTKEGFKSLFVDLIDSLSMHEQIGEAPMDNFDERMMPSQAVPDNTGALVYDTPGREPIPNMPRTAFEEPLI